MKNWLRISLVGIFLISTLAFANPVAKPSPPDFIHSHWGESRNQVAQDIFHYTAFMKLVPKLVTPHSIMFRLPSQVTGGERDIMYVFVGDKLVGGVEAHSKANDSGVWNAFEEVLKRRYKKISKQQLNSLLRRNLSLSDFFIGSFEYSLYQNESTVIIHTLYFSGTQCVFMIDKTQMNAVLSILDSKKEKA